jgi:hypothetical protein
MVDPAETMRAMRDLLIKLDAFQPTENHPTDCYTCKLIREATGFLTLHDQGY